MMEDPGNEGLSLDGVEAGYGETVVLEKISLSLSPGGTLAVLGRNGVGKTTLLATIMGHTALHAGHIRFAGRDVSTLPPYRRARLGIGLVPQEREIFPSLTVEENLLVAAQPGPWSLTSRALIGNPALLLMDEPLEGLAPVIVDTLLLGLGRVRREDHLALLLVEQHARIALEFAEDAIVLDRGRVVFAGPSRDLLDAPEHLESLMGVTARGPG